MSDDIVQLSCQRLGAALAGAALAASTMTSVALAAQLTQDPTLKATLERQTLNSVLGASQGSIGPQGPKGDPGPPGGAVTGLNLTSPTLGVLDDAQIVTSEGTAAAIDNQGALATQSSLTLGDPYLAGFGALSGLSVLAFGSDYLTDFGSLAGLNNALGLTAGAIVGQAQIATTGAYNNLVSIPEALAIEDGYLLAANMAYGSGALVSALEPAQYLADVTGDNTAASFVGIGALATQSALALGEAYLTGFGAVAGQSSLAYGSNYLTGFAYLATLSTATSLTAGAIVGQATIATTGAYANLVSVPSALGLTGGYLSASYMEYSTSVTVLSLQPAQVSADKTSSNTAAAIAGETYITTATSLAYGSSYLTGFGAVAGQSSLAYGSSYLTGFAYLATLSNALSLTAAAISNQGALASQSLVTWQTQFASMPPWAYDTLAGGVNGNTALNAFYISKAGSPSSNIQAYWPATTLADQTANATASAIANEGSLATLSQLGLGSSYLTGFGAVAGQSVLPYGSSYLSGFAYLATLSTATSLTAGAIVGQAPIATTGSYASLSGVPGAGQNWCVNSDFKKGLYGWAPGTASGQTVTVSQPLGSAYMYTAQLEYAGTIAVGSSQDLLSTGGSWIGSFAPNQFAIPIKAANSGQLIFAGCLMGSKNCTGELYVLGFDGNGNLTEANYWIGAKTYAQDSSVGNGDPAHYNFVGGVYTTTNSATRWISLMVRLQGTGNSSASAPAYVWVSQMQLGICAAGQTTVPPYVPGSADPYSDQTSSNTAAAIYNEGALASQSSVTWQTQFASMPAWAYDTLAGGVNGNQALNAYYISKAGSPSSNIQTYWPATTSADQTANATASAIINQSVWATYGGLNPSNVALQISYLSTSGQISSAAGLPLNTNTGGGYVYNPASPLSSSSTTTITISSTTITTANNQARNIGSGTISGLSASTTYAVFYSISTSSYVALASGAEAYYTSLSTYISMGVVTTMASGGSGTTGGGGGNSHYPLP